MSQVGDVTTYEYARVAPRGEVAIRRLLTLAWLLIAGGFVVSGGWTTTLDDLEGTLADGRFHEITVIGERLPDDGSGYVTQQVRWRDGLLTRVATVAVRNPTEESSLTPEDSDADIARITGHDVGDYLIERYRGIDSLSIVRADDPASIEVFGWAVPQQLALAFLVVQVLALIMLVLVHETWRATRAAWIWLWFVPFGVPAYLLLGGPGGPVRRPRPGARRLTGGWALLLALALSQPFWN